MLHYLTELQPITDNENEQAYMLSVFLLLLTSTTLTNSGEIHARKASTVPLPGQLQHSGASVLQFLSSSAPKEQRNRAVMARHPRYLPCPFKCPNSMYVPCPQLTHTPTPRILPTSLISETVLGALNIVALQNSPLTFDVLTLSIKYRCSPQDVSVRQLGGVSRLTLRKATRGPFVSTRYSAHKE